jgi:tyrosyl-tRNA synthetase
MSLRITINRALRSMQVVARDIEHARVSQIIYPFMQVADIKHLKIDLVEAGMDQRKIHMLGKELFKTINYKNPIFVHTYLIPSLKGPGSKMSSSDPVSMISVRDNPKEIGAKIKAAYCLPGDIKDNAVLAILKLIIFPRINKLVIKREKAHGGKIEFDKYEDVERQFKLKKIHPLDLKNVVSEHLIEILEPIRKPFEKKKF